MGNLDNAEPDIDEFGDNEYDSQVIDAYLAEANVLDSNINSKPWYLDSGASNHIIGDSFLFSSLKPCSATKITSAGG